LTTSSSIQAASLSGVARVLVADNSAYAHGLAENLAALVAAQVSGAAGAYTHVLTASTSVGKAFLPRAAVAVDSAPITDVVSCRCLSFLFCFLFVCEAKS
jgi:electron transfer flavoprotein alpha subunit